MGLGGTGLEWRGERGCSTQYGPDNGALRLPSDRDLVKRRPGRAIEEDTLDERLRQMIRELERSLSGALAETGGSLAGGSPAAATPPPFRINAADLAFLRSIGIDPTRRVRGRGSSRSSSR